MTGYIKEPHTMIFIGSTKCGKTHLVLDLTEKKYNKHFDCIIFTCPTLRWNKAYHSKDWIKIDDKVWLVALPKYIIHKTIRCNKIKKEKVGGLYCWIEKLSQLLIHSETLFIINDIIADESFD